VFHGTQRKITKSVSKTHISKTKIVEHVHFLHTIMIYERRENNTVDDNGILKCLYVNWPFL